MVERLRTAIEKARAQRDGGERQDVATAPLPGPASRRTAPVSVVDWNAAVEITPDPARLRAARITSYDRSDQSFSAFDVLRTRLLKSCRDNGWTRIGVTSATKACGKSTISLNLAFSVSRNELRTLLVDLDMRAPALAELLGIEKEPRRMSDYLRGEADFGAAFVRVGENLAIGVNTERERDAAELLQSAQTAATLSATVTALRPTIAIFDLPPILTGDDALAFAPNLDGVLLVAAAGDTTIDELRECERLLDGTANFLGVVLNKCSADSVERYAYAYE